MKRYLHVLLFALSGIAVATAQTAGNIVDRLNADVPGQGVVRVYIDPQIRNILGITSGSVAAGVFGNDTIETKQTPVSPTPARTMGYRVQVFFGNNPKTARNEAYDKQRRVKAAFPQMDVSVVFQSPFWRVRAGSFKSQAEANQTLRELKKAFPAFAKDMYVVRDQIRTK